MKKVCQKCGGHNLHKHGKKRRRCVNCGATCSIKSGRKRSFLSEMYILDRSTLKRISKKVKQVPSEVMRKTMNELKNIPKLLDITKKFSVSE